MEIAWIEYVLLGQGVGLVMVGLCERLGGDRLARKLKLGPGEADLLGSGSLLYFILFTVGNHLHGALFAVLTISTFMVWIGLMVLCHRNRHAKTQDFGHRAERRSSGCDGIR